MVFMGLDPGSLAEVWVLTIEPENHDESCSVLPNLFRVVDTWDAALWRATVVRLAEIFRIWTVEELSWGDVPGHSCTSYARKAGEFYDFLFVLWFVNEHRFAFYTILGMSAARYTSKGFKTICFCAGNESYQPLSVSVWVLPCITEHSPVHDLRS